MLVSAELTGQIYTVSLNRPEKHNALNQELIQTLTTAFEKIPASARVVVLKGQGPSFCAGADIHYMREQANYSPEENLADARSLSTLFKNIHNCALPVVGVAQGNIFGGGVGLAAACDILLCEKNARLCFSEVKIGLAPAVISPYIVSRMGAANARRYFLTAEVFSGEKAFSMGLADFCGDRESVGSELSSIISHITAAGPVAVSQVKKMLNTQFADFSQTEETLCNLIAGLRSSPEGQEGLSAFLEKRKPGWITTGNNT